MPETDDQRLRILVGLGLGANICVAHTYHCDTKIDQDGLHDLSGTKSVGRFARLATLNSLL